MIVFHRTSHDEAARIRREGFRSMENPPRVYVSSRRDGQADGYGEVCLTIEIAERWLELDDEFPDGERHFAIPVVVMNRHAVIVSEE